MIKKNKCVRCSCELDMFGFYVDAVPFEDELLAVDSGDDLCDECAKELVEREKLEIWNEWAKGDIA